jgi:hypothetical protein
MGNWRRAGAMRMSISTGPDLRLRSASDFLSASSMKDIGI